MIGGDVKVIKFCIPRNEVEMDARDWLHIICQTTEVGSCYITHYSERGGGGGQETSLFLSLFRHCWQSVCLCGGRGGVKEGGGCAAADVTVLKRVNM